MTFGWQLSIEMTAALGVGHVFAKSQQLTNIWFNLYSVVAVAKSCTPLATCTDAPPC